MRQRYSGNYSEFIYGGARLLQSIFPDFSSDFEHELLQIVKSGSEEDLEFVCGILRNYRGEPFVHSVCKEIIRSVPFGSEFNTEVLVALEATGVVSGAFGFSEAYERKKEEISGWLLEPDEKIKKFATQYIQNLDAMIDDHRKRAEESVRLRKFQYGENSNNN